MTPREAFTVVDRCAREPEIDQLLMDVLRYPSPQTDRLESDPQIKKFIVELGAPRLAELTGSSGAIDAMGNLIWRLGGAGGGGLLLMGYAMTFPAASMQDPFSGARVDGEPLGVVGQCALGRGACEQKGALAAMIYAAGIVARAVALAGAVDFGGEPGRGNRPA